jgi:hypothetical protein
MAARRCRGGVTTSWISCLDTRNDQPRERPGFLQYMHRRYLPSFYPMENLREMPFCFK